MTRYGMAIDLKKCIGCHSYTVACKVENGVRPGIFWNRVFDEETGRYPMVSRRFLPRPCMHCEQPACLEVCPTGATYRREDGIVLIDGNKCVGCKACMLACPYGARSFNARNGGYFSQGLTPYEEVSYPKQQKGTVEKCTFCVHRLDRGEEPACVVTCPPKARIFGDLNDPDSEVARQIRARHGAQLRAEMGTQPSVYYLS